MDKNPHIFLIRANQNIQEINRYFDGTLNHCGPMVFASNQEQNESYTFEETLLHTDKLDFILATIKEVEAHESRSHWKITKNSKVNNKHKNIYGELNSILSIWSFKRKIFPDRRLIKQKFRLCAHKGIQ